MFTSLIIPDATLDEMRWINDLERHSATPETAIRLIQVIGDIDVTELLPRLSAPVLSSTAARTRASRSSMD